MSKPQTSEIPSWLSSSQEYVPSDDRDAFIARSMLAVSNVLKQFRLDDGKNSRFSPSAPCKMLFVVAVIVLNSLSSNYIFALIMLALALVRACLLPGKVLARAFGIAVPAALIAFIIMIPAILLGQPHSALLISTKTLTSVLMVMEMTLSTPYNELTAGLRAFHIPSIVIMTVDLALKSIVSLGEVAVEVLTSLKLRSVGRNKDKGNSMGGVAGIVFLKSNEAANDTYAAMTCRGFDGEYNVGKKHLWRAIDLAWLVLFAIIVVAFIYLQGAIA